MILTKIFNQKYAPIEIARNTGRGNGLLLEILKSICGIFFLVCVTGLFSDFACSRILGDVVEEPAATIVILYSEIVGIVAGTLFCIIFERRNVHSVGFKLPMGKSYTLGLVFGAVLIAATVLLNMVFGGLCFSRINWNVDLGLQLLLLGGFVIQGLSEEVLFRGYVFVSMARKNSIPKAIIGSSVLFSLIHVFNDGFSVLPFLNITLFGVLEALFFLKTNDIWAAGALHSIWNYLQGCVFGLNVSGNALVNAFFVFEQTDQEFINGGVFGPEGGIVVTALVLAAVVILSVNMGKNIFQSVELSDQ